MSSPTVLPLGATALLVDLGAAEDPLAEVLAWHADLTQRPEPGQLEALAAARTVLLRFADGASARAASARLGHRRPAPADAVDARSVQIPTVYDGEDLAEVARLTGLSEQAVVAAHCGTEWRAAFGGFAPGFLYLAGGDRRLHVPRRDSPRTAVPAGSVALAGEFSAVYPRRSPGGWQLLGRTGERLWDLGRERPALLAPGDTVRFVPVRATATITGTTTGAEQGGTQRDAAPVEEAPAHAASSRAVLTVTDPGLLTLVQDLGRPGRGDLGVTGSGAADAPSARQANRLVGNPEGAPVLETLLGGLRLTALEPSVLALTGAIGRATIVAPSPEEGRDRAVRTGTPFALYPGETLQIGAPETGLRGYVGIRGPLAVDPVLGSAATDTLSGLGPAPLAAGDTLRVAAPTPVVSPTPLAPTTVAPTSAAAPGRPAAVGHPEPPVTALPAPGETVTLRATAGPRADWFGPDRAAGAATLAARSWMIGPDSDRVGARLITDGEPLVRTRGGELASEGMVPGAVQVPPDGLPVVFLADHPVSGGYPVVAVVEPADLPLAAQLPPGTPVRFRIVQHPIPGPTSGRIPGESR